MSAVTLQVGQSVTATTMGRSPKTVSGVLKEVVQSTRGEWVVVTTSEGAEVKTRPSLVKPA